MKLEDVRPNDDNYTDLAIVILSTRTKRDGTFDPFAMSFGADGEMTEFGLTDAAPKREALERLAEILRENLDARTQAVAIVYDDDVAHTLAIHLDRRHAVAQLFRGTYARKRSFFGNHRNDVDPDLHAEAAPRIVFGELR